MVENMIIKEAKFIKSSATLSECPEKKLPEYVFLGRSNVGKSSLINAITGRKSIARASNTPGRTQEINFFKTGDHHYLVDLPGYGFANAPINVVKKWQELLKRYLSGRSSLRRAFVLIDIRHGIKEVDEEIMNLLDTSAVTFQCILTKSDKVNLEQKKHVLNQVRKKLQAHPAAFPELVVTSAENKTGLEGLRSIIATLD